MCDIDFVGIVSFLLDRDDDIFNEVVEMMVFEFEEVGFILVVSVSCEEGDVSLNMMVVVGLVVDI